MRQRIALAAPVLAGLLLAACATPPGSGKPAWQRVEPDRFAGTWQLAAVTPEGFWADCGPGSRFTVRPTGKFMRVAWHCATPDGMVDKPGQARWEGEPRRGKLWITYQTLFGAWLWPAGDPVWVRDHGPDYGWLVMDVPGRDHVRVLTRDDALTSAEREAVMQAVRDAGYDPCGLKVLEGRPFCDV